MTLLFLTLIISFYFTIFSTKSAKANSTSKFHAQKVPTISVRDYLQRIAKYSECSKEVFILALIYIDRIIQCNHHFVATYHNIHRLTVVALMLGAKFFDDNYYNNGYYAKIGGVTTSEINDLEVEFVFMNNFSLSVTSETFDDYCNELLTHQLNANNNCYCGRSRALRLEQQQQQQQQQTHPYESAGSKPLQDKAVATAQHNGGAGNGAYPGAPGEAQYPIQPQIHQQHQHQNGNIVPVVENQMQDHHHHHQHHHHQQQQQHPLSVQGVQGHPTNHTTHRLVTSHGEH